MLAQAAQATISYLKLPQGNSCFPDDDGGKEKGAVGKFFFYLFFYSTNCFFTYRLHDITHTVSYNGEKGKKRPKTCCQRVLGKLGCR